MTQKMKSIAALGLLAAALGGGGCAYAGLAGTPDGTVYIARNDLLLLGLLRKVYACKPTGAGLACTEAAAP